MDPDQALWESCSHLQKRQDSSWRKGKTEGQFSCILCFPSLSWNGKVEMQMVNKAEQGRESGEREVAVVMFFESVSEIKICLIAFISHKKT